MCGGTGPFVLDGLQVHKVLVAPLRRVEAEQILRQRQEYGGLDRPDALANAGEWAGGGQMWIAHGVTSIDLRSLDLGVSFARRHSRSRVRPPPPRNKDGEADTNG